MTERHQMPQISGDQIRALRRNLGMTHLTFAKGLDVPIWLVEILEQERSDAPDQLSQIIPESIRNGFYQQLLKTYGSLETWSTARVDTSAIPDTASAAKESAEDMDELTLHIPVTVSVQMTMEWMDVFLREYESAPSCMAEKEKVTRYLIINLIQLHQLYCQASCAQGNSGAAKMNTALLRRRIFQRIQMLEAN